MSTPATDRRLGPDLTLTTGVGKDSTVLVLALTTGEAEESSLIAPNLVTIDGLFDDAAGDAMTEALQVLGATGAHGEITKFAAPPTLEVDWVLAIGVGAPAEVDAEVVRQAAGIAARELEGVPSAVTTLSVLDLAGAAEGLFLGAYRFDEFRSAKTEPKKPPVAAVALAVSAATGEQQAELDRSIDIATAVATARDLVNTPPNALFPAAFAERARTLAEAAGLVVEVLDETQLAEGGYGGITGVGQGSSRPPRLVRLTYSAGPQTPTVALVGKGITFDTGGISIKPAANMDHMTSDMGGAAAVIATVILAAKRKVGATVIATVPMAENMPSATAQRPGDVLTQYGGITVEVLNTDAEGRLVLADAIVRALEDNPDYLIDTATLTGAQMVALGTRTPGVMGTTEFRDRVAAISQEAGEGGWPMPFPKELLADLKSRVADLANVTNHRWGGMLSAGMFLREFVGDDVAWAHIDVAGPAFNTGGAWGYTPKGGTGVPVRTMFATIEAISG